MSRKLNPAKLYKLFRTVVILVSAFNLLLGAYFVINFDGMNNQAEERSAACTAEGKTSFCYYPYETLHAQENIMWRSLAIGIFLPAIFFGGKAIFNYITTDDKKKEEIV